MMPRRIRYQGAIIQGGQILLIQHREHASGRVYWLLPGGGREEGESEEECVIREMHEETGLEVKVERLLFDEPRPSGETIKRTYLCSILSGKPKPGYEPEKYAAEFYSIAAVGWFDLSQKDSWGELVRSDPFTYPQLKRLQKILGYD